MQDDQNLQNQQAHREGYDSRSLGTGTHQRADRGGGGGALFKATMTMAGGGGVVPDLYHIYIYTQYIRIQHASCSSPLVAALTGR